MKANACLIALQFLTRIPVKLRLSYTPEAMGKSVICFPIVGLLIGLVLYILSLMQPLWGSILTATIISVSWILLTGGLHMDGLADMVDGWVGSHGNKEKMLKIMKDSAIGPMGSLALGSVLVLKMAAISTLLEQHQTWLLISVPVIARGQLALLLVTTSYAKPSGMGIDMQRHAPMRAIWGVQWLILLLLTVLTNLTIVLAALISYAILIIYRQQLVAYLQGTTGDTAGAWVEISEVTLLLLLLSCITIGNL